MSRLVHCIRACEGEQGYDRPSSVPVLRVQDMHGLSPVTVVSDNSIDTTPIHFSSCVKEEEIRTGHRSPCLNCGQDAFKVTRILSCVTEMLY